MMHSALGKVCLTPLPVFGTQAGDAGLVCGETCTVTGEYTEACPTTDSLCYDILMSGPSHGQKYDSRDDFVLTKPAFTNCIHFNSLKMEYHDGLVLSSVEDDMDNIGIKESCSARSYTLCQTGLSQ